MEKISLDITPTVLFKNEKWEVGKVDYINKKVGIYRQIVIDRGGNVTQYDIEEKMVDADDLYKVEISGDTTKYIAKKYIW